MANSWRSPPSTPLDSTASPPRSPLCRSCGAAQHRELHPLGGDSRRRDMAGEARQHRMRGFLSKGGDCRLRVLAGGFTRQTLQESKSANHEAFNKRKLNSLELESGTTLQLPH